MTNDAPVYVGADLEAMSVTVNYHRWILDEFRPFIGKRIVEVGAGGGAFSEMLLGENPESLALVEPSTMFAELSRKMAESADKAKLSLHHAVFQSAAAEIVDRGRPDTIVYVNVLEHVEDDLGELRAMHDALTPDGHILIFVPALMSLYSEFDKRIGHFRRYRKAELEEKCRKAGFEVVKSRYFDFAGILPWYLKFKIMRATDLNPTAVTAYDRIAIPFVRLFERIVPVPIGKNVILAARKIG
jgi:2-polyprenyl-3-methyl-5-hydroxy-6-metoxy-1,4-benzoquinol methylase